jgi:hypothetical protein
MEVAKIFIRYRMRAKLKKAKVRFSEIVPVQHNFLRFLQKKKKIPLFHEDL